MDDIGALRITVSIGVAVALDDDVEAGLAQADLALYAAKSAGRNRARLFDSDQYDQVVRRVSLLRRVRTALDQDTMQLDAQPIVDLTTGRTSRYELLIRLRDGNFPLLGPVDFLPAAERTDLVLRLDRWVLERAIRALATPGARERRAAAGGQRVGALAGGRRPGPLDPGRPGAGRRRAEPAGTGDHRDDRDRQPGGGPSAGHPADRGRLRVRPGRLRGRLRFVLLPETPAVHLGQDRRGVRPPAGPGPGGPGAGRRCGRGGQAARHAHGGRAGRPGTRWWPSCGRPGSTTGRATTSAVRAHWTRELRADVPPLRG